MSEYELMQKQCERSQESIADLYRLDREQTAEREEAESEIALLKHNLSETDYIACKIAEGSSTKEDYAGQITLRQQWRKRIDELEQAVEKK